MTDLAARVAELGLWLERRAEIVQKVSETLHYHGRYLVLDLTGESGARASLRAWTMAREFRGLVYEARCGGQG